MPITLASTLAKIPSVPNQVNAALLQEYYDYLKNNGTTEEYQKTMLQDLILFSKSLKPKVTFYDIKKKETILAYLNTKIKSPEIDPEEKWKTTWNDYLGRIKAFFRWLHNWKLKSDSKRLPVEMWKTPDFANIPRKKTKRVSPYTVNQIWELDEVHTIVKYEPNPRNKTAITMQWDLNGRNKELTLIKNKHIHFFEKYAEGEIPYNSKTGGGAFLLTASFPYALLWMNQHPAKDDPEAHFIINQMTGQKIKPETLWRVMKVLKFRIENLLKNGAIKDEQERKKLEYLLKTKAWNPYCLRHSSITHDADDLPEFALRKKVRWSMNSKQPARYIKNRMGNDLKNRILARNGIVSEQAAQPEPKVRFCPRCNTANPIDARFCSKIECAYPLTMQAHEEISIVKQLLEMKEKQARLESELADAQMKLILYENPPASKDKIVGRMTTTNQALEAAIENILRKKGIT